MTADKSETNRRCEACDARVYPRQWFCRRCGHRMDTPAPVRLLREDLMVEELRVLDMRVGEETHNPVGAWLLWLLFGPLGVHRFYLEQAGPGIAVPFVTMSALTWLMIIPAPAAPLRVAAVAVVLAVWAVEAALLRNSLREEHVRAERDVLVEILKRREEVAARTPLLQ